MAPVATNETTRQVRFVDKLNAELPPVHEEAISSDNLEASGYDEVERSTSLWAGSMPAAQGLYDPDNEKDACGVGFLCQIKGKPAHKIVSDARFLLCNMTHRGAVGADARDGDGAGVMTGIPDTFFRRETERDLGVKLPAQGQYAVGNLFFNPKDDKARAEHVDTFTKIADKLGLRVLGWRDVPVDNSILGPASKNKEPKIMQPFVVLKDHYGSGSTPAETSKAFDDQYFGRQLYVLRKHATHTIGLQNWFYICSLSPTNIIYKGQLSPVQVYNYYYDLNNVHYASHFALVHSRFSTNTFPSWDRAQPMRWAAHNGEINTIRGNKNWMRAREGLLKSETFGDELDLLYPIIEGGGSDSAAFDNVLELLVINKVLTLPQAVMMMIPEAWQGDNFHMEPEKVAFYQWAACLMEPWDGPALFTFADGRYCGANLDRNGLRPCRYYITDDDIMICASEVGTVTIDPKTVIAKGRLQPGKMLLVDTVEGRVVEDRELKMTTAQRADFAAWLENQMLRLPEIVDTVRRSTGNAIAPVLDSERLSTDPKLLAFGYTAEQINLLMLPMVTDGKEALGSMGNDAPLACISTAPRVIYDYFRELFAQVTNPPIDPIRESIVMSLEQYVGPEGNLLEMKPEQCHRLLLPSPILSIDELAAIKQIDSVHGDWTTKTIDITFDKGEGIEGYERTLDRICSETSQAIRDGYRVVVLSDRAVSADRVAISSLVACGGVHHHLIRNKERSRIALMIESAEAREVHHMCVLLGYGADAICPWLAMEAILKVSREGLVKADLSGNQLIDNWTHAVDNGILKVMSKMGISTLASYKGAQIFEALGLANSVVDRCFAGTASRISGSDFTLLAMDALEFHDRGYPSRDTIAIPGLPESGEYHYRDGGEEHINNPQTIAHLQDSARERNQAAWDAYSKASHNAVKATSLRGLLDFDFTKSRAIPIDQVEPWTEIVQRFCTGAMSYGSISMEAHSALAIAMNRLGGKSNTGEGGEDAERSIPLPNGDSLRSKIKQIASGRFGVTSNYLADSDELQIKMAQGAKPGEGGELPGHKVSPSIARTRHSTAGVGLISPPPHHDIYSIEDLKQLIYDLKCANPRARVSVKLVSEVGVGIVASGVAKAKADHILISGHDGGTGASRWTGIKYAGLPWELGLAETHQTLVLNDLRGRVAVQTDGQLRTGRDVAIACLLGAEEWCFATAPLIALGCIMLKRCLGVGTQVQTPNGLARVEQLQVGDNVLDQFGNPVLVTAVRDPATGPMYEIEYSPFDSANWQYRLSSFRCTPDHILVLTISGAAPTLCETQGVRRRVDWRSWCHTSATKSAEAGLEEELAWLEAERLEAEAIASNVAAAQATEAATAGWDDSDEASDEGSEELAREIALRHVHRGEGSGQHVFREHTVCHDDDDADFEFSSLFGTSDEETDGDDADSGFSPNSSPAESISDMSEADVESLLAGCPGLEARLRVLRDRLALTRRCRCGVFRKVAFSFPDEASATLVHRVLASDKYYLIDPLLVRDGERFEVTAQQYAENAHISMTKPFAKLFRKPTAFSGETLGHLPIDPYLLGLWFGDGRTGRFAISSSEPEVLLSMQNAVNLANASRPSWAAPLVVTSRVQTPAGTVVHSCVGVIVTRRDVYMHAISSSVASNVRSWWNPYTSFLREHGLLASKAGGVPRIVFESSVQARLAFLAGLMDSDGYYVQSADRYRLDQSTEEHFALVEHTAQLATSVGIHASGPTMLYGQDGPRMRVDLSGEALSKLQPYIKLDKKRRSAPVKSHNRNVRGISKISLMSTPGQYRGVEVSGGTMLLHDGVVVHNCHTNQCAVGVASQDPELRAKFAGQPEHVINFFYYLAEELRSIMAKLGLRTINEMVGRSDLLRVDDSLRTPKTANLDLSAMLKPAHQMRPGAATYKVRQQDHKLYVRLDNKFIDEAEPALTEGLPVQIDCDVVNTDRALGTTLSYRVSKLYGEEGLPRDTIHINAKGSAGQSLGAFLAPGITIELEGDSNDYCGKGLSGGRLVVYPPKVSSFKAEENIIVGNTCLYGATSGHAYFRGIAAERFAVRNSGAHAVVEGVGDHGCEYMTGGRVVILGPTGRNFAAGMSGGIAYVLDMNRDFHSKCNTEMVELGPVKDPQEIAELRNLLENHRHYTGSTVADHVLHDFHHLLPRFVRVMPTDYKRVLEEEAAKAAVEKKRSSHVDLLGTLSRHGSQVDVSVSEDKPKDNAADNVREIPAAKPAEPAVVDVEDSMVDDETAKARLNKLDKVRGFMKYKRLGEHYRNPTKRIRDYKELSTRLTESELKYQTARCMDCGVPFCQGDTGCPISNIIPKWNDLVFKGQWEDALNRLLMTNNFPEFTGRVCPAPCEGACVLGITEQPVGIKTIECAIIDKGFEEGWMVPRPPKVRTGKTVAIIGSGPAGLACADQLNKAGHSVTVYERADRIGGLLMYGIPNMKLDKGIVQRRVDLMAAEGVNFVPNTYVGRDVDPKQLQAQNDAIVYAVGATWPRDLKVPGREADGVHFAMDFLAPNTKSLLDSGLQDGHYLSAKGKDVIVIGGGDTGCDAQATALRHGAKSIVNFELLPQPPNERAKGNPWPQFPRVFKVDYGHAEVAAQWGSDPREYCISTTSFEKDAEGKLVALNTIKVNWELDASGKWQMNKVPGSEKRWPCDLCLLSLGFLGPENDAISALGLEQDGRSNIKADDQKGKSPYKTNVEGVYTAGDCRRGQSLIVWGIQEGRACAAQVDRDLVGNTRLPWAGSIKKREFLPISGEKSKVAATA